MKNPCSTTDFICTSARDGRQPLFFLKFNLSHKLQLLNVQHTFCPVMCYRYTVLIWTPILLLFTALHVMQTRYCEEISVCLSVCPSVCHTRDPWQNGKEICSDFYTIRKNIYSSFLRRKMVGGGRPLLPEILGQPTPIGEKSPILNR